MSIEAILLYLANNNFTYEYVLIFFVLSIIGFSLPIPYTLIIITNIYVFGWFGPFYQPQDQSKQWPKIPACFAFFFYHFAFWFWSGTNHILDSEVDRKE